MRRNASGAALALAAILAARPMAGAAPPSRVVVERSLHSFNRHDLEAVAASFHPDAQIWTPGGEKPDVSGREAIRGRFLEQFRDHPKIQATFAKIMELGPWAAALAKMTPGPDEDVREALLVFEVREGSIRRVWVLPARDEDGGGEGPVALQIERLNTQDLPRLLATYDAGATISLLASGERLAAGEEALRDQFEKAFEGDASRRTRVLQRMALSPWVIYLERVTPAPPGGGEAIVIYEVRDDRIRRVWIAS